MREVQEGTSCQAHLRIQQYASTAMNVPKLDAAGNVYVGMHGLSGQGLYWEALTLHAWNKFHIVQL